MPDEVREDVAASESEDYSAWKSTAELAEAEPTQPEAPSEASVKTPAESDAAPDAVVDKTEPEEEEPETEDDEADDDEEGQHEEGQQPKPGKKGLKKRFAELTRQKRELEERLAAAEAAAKGKPAAEPVAETVEQPTGKPVLENFDTYEEYVEALTDWKVKQHSNEQAKRAAAEVAQREAAVQWQRKTEAAKAAHPDFEAVLNAVDDIVIPEHVSSLLLESDLGAEVAYVLAKDREALQRIAGLSPTAAAREIGRIEGSLHAPAQKPKPVTNAPRPVPAIRGRSVSPPPPDPGEDFTQYRRR